MTASEPFASGWSTQDPETGSLHILPNNLTELLDTIKRSQVFLIDSFVAFQWICFQLVHVKNFPPKPPKLYFCYKNPSSYISWNIDSRIIFRWKFEVFVLWIIYSCFRYCSSISREITASDAKPISSTKKSTNCFLMSERPTKRNTPLQLHSSIGDCSYLISCSIRSRKKENKGVEIAA